MDGRDLEMREWCHDTPKIELHAHLNGSIRDSTLLELAEVLGEKGVIVFEDVAHVIMKNGRSLPECFKLFDLYHILTTDHETVARITKEVVEDFAAENVVYLELRTTPKKNEAKGMTKQSYMKAVIDGLRAVDTVDVALANSDSSTNYCLEPSPINDTQGRIKRKKIYVRLLLSIDRRETTASAMETVDLAMELKDSGVVGIDLSGNPVVGEWQTFIPALKHAKELGLPLTLHCAEIPNRKEVQAMLGIRPERIGHACFIEEEEWRRIKSAKIPVEICLTSNIRTERFHSINDHHFVDLYSSKHPVVLCTDDCGLFSTTLSNEYYLAASTFVSACRRMHILSIKREGYFAHSWWIRGTLSQMILEVMRTTCQSISVENEEEHICQKKSRIRENDRGNFGHSEVMPADMLSILHIKHKILLQITVDVFQRIVMRTSK